MSCKVRIKFNATVTEFEVDTQDTVETLQYQIASLLDIIPEEQQLSIEGNLLYSNTVIGSVIQDGQEIFLKKIGESIPLTVTESSEEKKQNIRLSQQSTNPTPKQSQCFPNQDAPHTSSSLIDSTSSSIQLTDLSTLILNKYINVVNAFDVRQQIESRAIELDWKSLCSEDNEAATGVVKVNFGTLVLPPEMIQILQAFSPGLDLRCIGAATRLVQIFQIMERVTAISWYTNCPPLIWPLITSIESRVLTRSLVDTQFFRVYSLLMLAILYHGLALATLAGGITAENKHLDFLTYKEKAEAYQQQFKTEEGIQCFENVQMTLKTLVQTFIQDELMRNSILSHLSGLSISSQVKYLESRLRLFVGVYTGDTDDVIVGFKEALQAYAFDNFLFHSIPPSPNLSGKQKEEILKVIADMEATNRAENKSILPLLYRHADETDRAVTLFSEISTDARRLGNPILECYALINLSSIQVELQQFRTALTSLARVVDIVMSSNNHLLVEGIRMLPFVGLALLGIGQGDSAKKLLKLGSTRGELYFQILSQYGLTMCHNTRIDIISSLKVLLLKCDRFRLHKPGVEKHATDETFGVSPLEISMRVYELAQELLLPHSVTDSLKVAEYVRAPSLKPEIGSWEKVILPLDKMEPASVCLFYSITRNVVTGASLVCWILHQDGSTARAVKIPLAKDELLLFSRQPNCPSLQGGLNVLEFLDIYENLIFHSDICRAINPTVEKLYLIPQGTMFALPFAALKIGHSSKGLLKLGTLFPFTILLCLGHLVENGLVIRHAQVNATDSMLTLKPFFALLGDPECPLPIVKLSYAGSELKSIENTLHKRFPASSQIKVMSNTDFTNENDKIKNLVEKATLAHFSSHGEGRTADNFYAIGGSILLSGSPATFLKAEEIRLWNLRGLKLVVLALCDGGIGNSTFALGLLGLSQAFLQAGVKAVVAAVAPVDDQSTFNFMSDFYSAIVDGQSPAVALHTARLKAKSVDLTLTTGDSNRSQFRTTHPFRDFPHSNREKVNVMTSNLFFVMGNGYENCF